MSSSAKITLDKDKLFHSFQTKVPIPVPPTSISAATITSQAMPIEIRIPVRMVGAAAGSTTCSARRKPDTSSVRATFSHSRLTDPTPWAVLINIGQTEQMLMTKIDESEESRMVYSASGI